MIKIKQSKNADTRSAEGEVTKDMLLDNSLSHIGDVSEGCNYIAELLKERGGKHDYTKIDYIDDFHDAFKESREWGSDFKRFPWWQKHMDERHHLNDRCPEDVDLIDVLEMIIDCCMAGMARSGNVYDIELSSEILQRAVENTKNMLIDEIEVLEEEQK